MRPSAPTLDTDLPTKAPPQSISRLFAVRPSGGQAKFSSLSLWQDEQEKLLCNWWRYREESIYGLICHWRKQIHRYMYYNWTLVYFFLFLLKNGFSFRFFMFTILAWPISLHILMFFTFYPLEIEIYRYVHHLKYSIYIRYIFTSIK